MSYGRYNGSYHPYFLANDIGRKRNWQDPNMKPNILVRIEQGVNFISLALKAGPAQRMVKEALGCDENDQHRILLEQLSRLQNLQTHISWGALLWVTDTDKADLQAFFRKLGALINKQGAEKRAAYSANL